MYTPPVDIYTSRFIIIHFNPEAINMFVCIITSNSSVDIYKCSTISKCKISIKLVIVVVSNIYILYRNVKIM